MKIGLVVEGPTDRVVLEGIIREHLDATSTGNRDIQFRHQSEPVAPMDTSPLCETFKDSPIFCATLKIGKKRTGHAAGHCPGV